MAHCTLEQCAQVPKCFRCMSKANRASAARSKLKRIERLASLRSDNTELDQENEEAGTELAEADKKNLELRDKIKAVEYSKIAVLSYLQFKTTPR